MKTSDGLAPAGLPHSAIRGSLRVCHSPRLIAAYHGLPRLRVPRHPPHAFARLTTTCCGSSRAVRSPSFPFNSSDNQTSIAGRKRKSLNKDSQIRDLPQLPLSNSVDAQYPGYPRSTASMQQKLNLGLDVSRRATYGKLSADQEIRRACLRSLSGPPGACASVGLLVYPLRR